MTTTQIASYADPEGLAVPDINLQVELRRGVIPEFYEDVSEVGWRRVYGVEENLPSGSRDFLLPLDFSEMKKIIPGTAGEQTFDDSKALAYIGDNPDLVLRAEATTTAGAPSGYYLDWTTSPYPSVKLSALTDQVYTFRYVYLSRLNFENDTTVIELDRYIPRNFQWGLVEGLKKVIYERRYGVGDQRWITADARYQKIIRQAKKNRERTGQERPRFVN